MAGILTPIRLSGSTNGRPIKVAATATPGTLIHTAHATANDFLYVFVSNSTTSAVALTLELGGTTDPDDLAPKTYVIPANSNLIPIYVGIPLSGGLVLRAFAGSANVLLITGRAMRYQV